MHATKITMDGLHHTLDLHEESGGLVLCAQQVEQGDGEGAMVAQVSEDGTILRVLDDS
jgi:hypothetical protein